jgi:hypothetical protein
MKIETGKCLYAKCDCMNNFKEGQTVGVNILPSGVVALDKETVEKYFTDNPFYDSEYDDSKTKFSELKEAAKPLIEFLNKYYDPMTTAIITEGRIDILTNEMGIPLEVRD